MRVNGCKVFSLQTEIPLEYQRTNTRTNSKDPSAATIYTPTRNVKDRHGFRPVDRSIEPEIEMCSSVLDIDVTPLVGSGPVGELRAEDRACISVVPTTIWTSHFNFQRHLSSWHSYIDGKTAP